MNGHGDVGRRHVWRIGEQQVHPAALRIRQRIKEVALVHRARPHIGARAPDGGRIEIRDVEFDPARIA